MCFIVWGCAWHYHATRDLLLLFVMVPVALVALLTPVLLRFSQSFAANWLIGTTILSMGMVTLLSGGTSIGPLVVSMIAPLFAFMLCGIRYGIFWSVVTFLFSVALLVAIRFDITFYATLPIETAFRGLLGSAPTIILLGAAAAIVYERARSSALSQLTTSHSQLRSLGADLEVSEERYRRVSELTSDFAYQVSIGPDNAITLDWMTQAVEEITGYSAEELLTLDPKTFIHEDDLQRVCGLWERVISGESVEAEFRILHPAAGTRWLRAGAASQEDPSTGRRQIWGATRDITTELEQAAKIQNQQRLETLGQLTGGVAHDFNNLLGVITGSLDLLKSQNQHLVNGELIDEASQAAYKGADLVTRLMAFSRQQPNRPTELDLNQHVEALMPLLRRAVGERVELRFEPARESALIFADASQLENTLLNLCLNARDAITGSGRITVRVRISDRHNLLLEVVDNGSGMSEETVKRAMDPFFTTKEKGSGLGLSTAYGFAQQAGGEIRIATAQGEGSTVSISFPRMTDSRGEESNGADADLNRGNGTVLFVDDQPALRRIGKASLEALGYSAHTVATAEEAIAYLQTNTLPDAVLSDWILPGDLDGFGLACWVRGVHPQLPVMLMTGFAPDSLEARGERFPILMKPFSLSQLSSSIQGIMR